MEAVPGEEGAFYMLTNRGPVAGGTGAGEKVFIAKRFNPHIAKFKLAGDSMRLVRKITLTIATGEANGIPNPPLENIPAAGTTGEPQIGNAPPTARACHYAQITRAP